MKVFRLCCKSMNFTHRYQLDIVRTQDADWRLGRKWSFRFWSEDSVEKFFFIFCCQFFVSSKAEIWQKCVANNVHPKIPPNFMKKSQLDVPIPTRSRENPDRHWPSIRANPDPGLPYQIHFRLDFLCFVLIFTPQPSGLEGYCRHGPGGRAGGLAGGRAGGRAGGCQTCGTHISVTAWWIFSVRSSMELSRPVVVHCHAHLPICSIWACPWAENLSNLPQIGSRLCGSHISETAGWIYPI